MNIEYLFLIYLVEKIKINQTHNLWLLICNLKYKTMHVPLAKELKTFLQKNDKKLLTMICNKVGTEIYLHRNLFRTLLVGIIYVAPSLIFHELGRPYGECSFPNQFCSLFFCQRFRNYQIHGK